MVKRTKQYVILHIESGEYLKTLNLKIKTKWTVCFWITLLPKNEYTANLYYPYNENYFKDLYGISRRDFQLKASGIYFNDKISAITFLRDIYLPKLIFSIKKYNKHSWNINKKIRVPERSEFEIVEV